MLYAPSGPRLRGHKNICCGYSLELPGLGYISINMVLYRTVENYPLVIK